MQCRCHGHIRYLKLCLNQGIVRFGKLSDNVMMKKLRPVLNKVRQPCLMHCTQYDSMRFKQWLYLKVSHLNYKFSRPWSKAELIDLQVNSSKSGNFQTSRCNPQQIPATHYPAMLWEKETLCGEMLNVLFENIKTQIVKIEDCQNWNFSKLQIMKITNCLNCHFSLFAWLPQPVEEETLIEFDSLNGCQLNWWFYCPVHAPTPGWKIARLIINCIGKKLDFFSIFSP